jgi:CheY-like chemotaxis protein
MPDNPRIIQLLLLEDNPDDVFLFKAALKRLRDVQFELVQVDRLSEALQAFREKTFDIVIADLNVPDSIGLPTIQRLIEDANSVPVIALTGWEDPSLGAQLLEEGVFGHWSKDRLDGPSLANAILNAVIKAGLLDRSKTV